MTQNEYQMQMDRLINTYGAQHYKQERLALIWRSVSQYSADWFAGVIDGFLSTYRQAPLPADFSESLSQERSRVRKEKEGEGLEEWIGPYTCESCKDTGVYVLSHPTRGGIWAFRCDCPRGCNDSRKKIPQFKQAHADEGYFAIRMPVYRSKKTGAIVGAEV